jgi:hypothetical protein
MAPIFAQDKLAMDRSCMMVQKELGLAEMTVFLPVVWE